MVLLIWSIFVDLENNNFRKEIKNVPRAFLAW